MNYNKYYFNYIIWLLIRIIILNNCYKVITIKYGTNNHKR